MFLKSDRRLRQLTTRTYKDARLRDQNPAVAEQGHGELRSGLGERPVEVQRSVLGS